MQQDTTMQERIAPAAQRAAEQDEDTIDLLELALGLLEHWKLIAVTAVTGAVLMALYTFFLVTPMYKATATIYVVSRNDSVLNFSDLQVGSELTSDYIKVFEMWEVHEKVISNLDLDYTYTDMASMLSVTNTSDTRMLDITVTNPDPEEAAAIANEYADVGAKYISEKMKTDEPTLMSSARVPENPFSPNKAKNILLGFVVGFVLACAVVVLRILLDVLCRLVGIIQQDAPWWCCASCWMIPTRRQRTSVSTPVWWCWHRSRWPMLANSRKRKASSSAAPSGLPMMSAAVWVAALGGKHETAEDHKISGSGLCGK